MKDFSVILPSRGVKEPVLKMLDSFERTTRKKDKLEFLIAIDDGEVDIVKTVLSQKYTFDIRFYHRPVTDDFTNDYYNWLAIRTRGMNILGFNDDAWMRTDAWDDIIRRTIDEYGWDVYMCDITDTAQVKYGNPFPCFPMVSRKALCTVGFLIPPVVRMYPGDKLTHQMYGVLRRIIKIPDVLIEHDHIHESDSSKDKMMRVFHEDLDRLKGEPINLSVYIEKLMDVTLGQKEKPSKLKRIINIIKEK